MGLNFSFKDFFNNRPVLSSGIAIVMLSMLFITTAFTTRSDRDVRVKELNLRIRQFGHRLLLQAGDSTSRVLPVTEIKEGTFLLEFESEFVFSHDSLMTLSLALFPKAEFPAGYTVTVHDCVSAGIVYGFQVNNSGPDILSCRGRRQPPGCYRIEFAFHDFYEIVEQKKADIDHSTEELKSSKADPPSTDPQPEEDEIPLSGQDIGQLTEADGSLNVATQEVSTEPEETTTLSFPVINLAYIGMMVLFAVTLLIGRFGKKLTPVPVLLQNHTVIKESVPEFGALGKFSFDVTNQRLLLGTEVISLTDKECRILELLNENFGELIPRGTLMQKVWFDEGVITGRSLDMFVSKLRKKLSNDPDLRITNVHGKGYKLEVAVG